MNFGLIDVLNVIGALGFFIFGMKLMSEGLQKAAGTQLRRILQTMTTNRYIGVFTGFLITALLQSSSATTVMTVSFVNAGLLSLVESAGIMMGANIGTTITGWLVSTLGLGKVKLAAYALPIIAVGFPMMFINKGKWKAWSEFLIGFALLFMGLALLKDQVPDIKGNPEALEFLAAWGDMGYLSYLIFIAVGALLTIIIQSSSASMTLTLVMCANGWIPFSVGAAMVLGENIGTTITAELASLVGNVHAKRSARIHSMFNIIGVVWMVILLPVVLKAIAYVFVNYLGFTSPFEDRESIPMALAAFHTFFNFTNVLLLIWFVPVLVKVAISSVPAKEGEEAYSLKYMAAGNLATPDMSLQEAKKETYKLAELTAKMHGHTSLLLLDNPRDYQKLSDKIKAEEQRSDDMEMALSDFLAQISSQGMSQDGANRMLALLTINSELEKIADNYYQMTLTDQKIMSQNLKISAEIREEITMLFDLVGKQMRRTVRRLDAHYKDVVMEDVYQVENKINKKRDKLHKKFFKSMEAGEMKAAQSVLYLNIINSAEKVGDHLVNVNEAMVGGKNYEDWDSED